MKVYMKNFMHQQPSNNLQVLEISIYKRGSWAILPGRETKYQLQT